MAYSHAQPAQMYLTYNAFWCVTVVRKDGIIELDEYEIRYLWEKRFNAKLPEELSLEDAAKAILAEYGGEQIEVVLRENS